jgi:hypothetical protein
MPVPEEFRVRLERGRQISDEPLTRHGRYHMTENTSEMIRWSCQRGDKWEWVNGDPSGPSSREPREISGSLRLPSNEDYWHRVAELHVPGDSKGYAFLKYWNKGGNLYVQAAVLAVQWVDNRPIPRWRNESVAARSGKASHTGGLSLSVEVS